MKKIFNSILQFLSISTIIDQKKSNPDAFLNRPMGHRTVNPDNQLTFNDWVKENNASLIYLNGQKTSLAEVDKNFDYDYMRQHPDVFLRKLNYN